MDLAAFPATRPQVKPSWEARDELCELARDGDFQPVLAELTATLPGVRIGDEPNWAWELADAIADQLSGELCETHSADFQRFAAAAAFDDLCDYRLLDHIVETLHDQMHDLVLSRARLGQTDPAGLRAALPEFWPVALKRTARAFSDRAGYALQMLLGDRQARLRVELSPPGGNLHRLLGPSDWQDLLGATYESYDGQTLAAADRLPARLVRRLRGV